MKKLGVPYSDEEINNAVADLTEQSKEIQARLAAEKIKVSSDKEIIALIAYLQRLGTDIAKK
jgi:cytochrome c oxidase cbb3-type subunit I/II